MESGELALGYIHLFILLLIFQPPGGSLRKNLNRLQWYDPNLTGSGYSEMSSFLTVFLAEFFTDVELTI